MLLEVVKMKNYQRPLDNLWGPLGPFFARYGPQSIFLKPEARKTFIVVNATFCKIR
jgi:hypothetical protein